MRKLPSTVVALGLVSFFTDLSSEMIYPLLPLFLTGVLGAGKRNLGFIEGLAEATAALLKVVSGLWADKGGKRKPFVLFGYGIASLARPCIGLAHVWPMVLLLRFLDRIGKGLRSSPRDALIADVISPDMRGRAYGFHRAMDHAGSVAGPLIAAALIHLAGFSLGHVFLAAGIPALIVIPLILFKVKEKPEGEVKPNRAPLNLKKNWALLPQGFKGFLLALTLFSLGNATDLFLLLALSERDLSAPWVLILWSAHSVVKMVAAWLAGGWADRIGRRIVILAGWATHILVYATFAFAESREIVIAAFMLYGFTNGLTEPAEKALVADYAPADQRGGSFGYYHGVVGLCALPASLIFGFLWDLHGATSAFLFDAVLAVFAVFLFAALVPPHVRR